MKLLLTNDDGVNAEGIYALAKELEKEHDIIIVAPSSQKSACGHSITLSRPLLVKEVQLEGINSKAYSVDGTPADCVRIALDKLVDGKIDMVISGINKGPNLGTDVLYSGTVSAAIEGAMYKVPAVAVSLDVYKKENGNYEAAAKYANSIITMAKENNIGENIVLNVNVPNISEDDIKGIKVCKIGSRTYTNNFIALREDSDGVLYDLRDKLIESHHDDTDTYYINEGYVTITPLHYDLTNFNLLFDVSNWF